MHGLWYSTTSPEASGRAWDFHRLNEARHCEVTTGRRVTTVPRPTSAARVIRDPSCSNRYGHAIATILNDSTLNVSVE